MDLIPDAGTRPLQSALESSYFELRDGHSHSVTGY